MADVDQHHLHLHLLLSSSPLCESPPTSNNRRHHVHPRHPHTSPTSSSSLRISAATTLAASPPRRRAPPREQRMHSSSSGGKPGRARACWQRCRAAAGDEAAVADPPLAGRTPGTGPVAVAPHSDAYRRRSVHLARAPVVTSSETKLKRRPVAATSCTISEKSDRWIGNFFAPSQSRFAGPTSSACISSTAAPFGVLPVPVRSWTLWLQWDPYTYQLFRLSRRIAWRCLLA
ncbi:putative lysine-rich arabinogalactan protein 19 [Iris pallida]|uniref:Lysine-rich arabinogalactan protein 19 n=1 Tax=Iris pallida TaxID=29817 RepID=A0AAX6ESZ2_IRIPA|nr:putative lysine-rich arabinogalactan protein 19 [Iris pallida]